MDVQRRAYSVTEAARALGFSRAKAHREIKAGRLRSVKAGGRRLVPVEALDEYLNSFDEEGAA